MPQDATSTASDKKSYENGDKMKDMRLAPEPDLR